MLQFSMYLHVTALLLADRAVAGMTRLRDEKGQTSAEYAMVLFGAAIVALLIAAWARKTGKLGKLFDTVIDSVTKEVK